MTWRFPTPLTGLLLLLAAAAWTWPLPAPWDFALLPGLAGLALAYGLALRPRSLRIAVGGAAVLALIALYAWNPTHEWKEGLGLIPVDSIRWLPGSAYPPGSREALSIAAAMVAAFVLAFRLSNHGIGWLQVVAALAGAAMALAVLVQRLEPKPWPVFPRTGLFVNENHFAAFGNMILPVVLFLAARVRIRAAQEGKPSSPAGLFVLAAILLGAAVLACRSRAGAGVMALLILAQAGLFRRVGRKYPFCGLPNSPGARRFGWLAIPVAAGLLAAVVAREWRQVADIAGEWTFRSAILKDAWAVWQAQPFWGTGPGTFSAVFPYYQSGALEGRTILHAHCEPVQFLSEFGLAGGAWVLCAAGWALSARRPGAPPSPEVPPFAELERPAFAFGLLACALHAAIDFPLRIPLLAVLAAAWAGAWAGLGPGPACSGIATAGTEA